MLIRFEFYNYRSFRDKNVLCMEAKGNAKGFCPQQLFLEKTAVEKAM